MQTDRIYALLAPEVILDLQENNLTFNMPTHSNSTGMFTLFAEIFCISFAVVTGIIAFPNMNRFFKVLLIQVSTWGIFYGASHIITFQQQKHHQPIDDQWLMNVHLIIETGLLLAATWFVLPQQFKKPLIGISFFLFLTVALIQSRILGCNIYLNYADVAACMVLTLTYALVMHTLGQRPDQSLWNAPEKWACLGILMYFACSVPFVSMMHYLQEHSPKMNTFLYYLISNILANLRYLMLGIAFLKLYRNKIHHTPTP